MDDLNLIRIPGVLDAQFCLHAMNLRSSWVQGFNSRDLFKQPDTNTSRHPGLPGWLGCADALHGFHCVSAGQGAWDLYRARVWFYEVNSLGMYTEALRIVMYAGKFPLCRFGGLLPFTTVTVDTSICHTQLYTITILTHQLTVTNHWLRTGGVKSSHVSLPFPHLGKMHQSMHVGFFIERMRVA